MKYVYVLMLLAVLFALSGCFTVATQEDLETAQQKLATDIRAIESAVVDAIPVPIPKDATKEMLGWLSDLVILGGGAGAVGIAGKKALNGKKRA